MMSWQGDWSWGAWLAMTVTMLSFWALVIWVVTSLARSGSRDHRQDAGAILDERFARGEIDEEEYRHRRELIRSNR